MSACRFGLSTRTLITDPMMRSNRFHFFPHFFVLIASLNLNSRSFALIRFPPNPLLFPIRRSHRAAEEEYDIVCCICIPLVNCNRLVFPNGYNGFLYMQNVVRVAYIQNHSYGKELLKHGTYTNNAQNMPILYVFVCHSISKTFYSR